MYASVWAAVNVAPARYWVSPAVPSGMHPGKRMMMRMPCGSPSFAWPSSMAATGIARSLYSCASKAGMSITRKSNACGARKACRCRDVTGPASAYMITSIPSSECVSGIRIISGAWTSSKIDCFGDVVTRCSRSLMNIRVSV